MNIIELKSFLAVVEYHSISLASKKMHVTQPAMTRRIQRMEERLGIQLVKISPSGVELTEKGKLCLPYVRQLLHVHEELMKQLKGGESSPRLVINIGASIYIAQTVLPSIQKYMNSLSDKLLLNIRLIAEQDIVDALISGSLDVAIAPLNLSYPKTVTSLSLWQERLLPVVAESHPLQSKKGLTLTDLASSDAILMEKGLVIRQKIDELAWNNGLTFKVVSEANTIYNNIALVQQHLGWSVIYERLLNSNLIAINVEGWDINIEFNCYFLTKRKEERIILLFLEHFLRYIKVSNEFKRFALNKE